MMEFFVPVLHYQDHQVSVVEIAIVGKQLHFESLEPSSTYQLCDFVPLATL